MALWRIKNKRAVLVPETQLKREKFLEQNLEDWIASEPSLLGEPLFIISRQVRVPDTRDRIDLLAADTRGAIVIIEIKRGDLHDPVDIQALRYASYISKWTFENFEAEAKRFYKQVGNQDYKLIEKYEEFCTDAGVDEAPNLNEEQRIIIVGSAVRDKLGSVALWLRERRVDITLVEIQAFKQDSEVMLVPNVVVPTQLNRFQNVGKVRAEGSPWTVDGKKWHLEKRCSTTTREMLGALEKVVRELGEADGPHWNQKGYIAWRVNNRNWLYVNTHPTSLVLDFLVKTGTFRAATLAKQMGLQKFDKEDSLADKLRLGSSVFIKHRSNKTDRIRIRAKKGFTFESRVFHRFVKDAYDTCPD